LSFIAKVKITQNIIASCTTPQISQPGVWSNT